MKRFDIKKLKYLMGAIKNGMSDDDILSWMEHNNYTIEDLYHIFKIILKDRDDLIKKIESN